eukprot:5861858-Prorocentrum_lima.AAC.1
MLPITRRTSTAPARSGNAPAYTNNGPSPILSPSRLVHGSRRVRICGRVFGHGGTEAPDMDRAHP